MEKELTVEEKSRILHKLYRILDEKFEFKFWENDVQELFGVDDMLLEKYLYEISGENFEFEVLSDDGLQAQFFGSIKDTQSSLELLQRAHNRVLKEKDTTIQSQASRIKELEDNIENILSFNPDKLGNQIHKALKDVNDISELISKNENLKSLSESVNDIKKHLGNVTTVNDEYIEIYKHIIKPIEKQSKQSAKHTAWWGIIGIIITTIVSIILQYYMK